MRLTGSRAYTRPAPVPKMPPGLVELMEGLTKEVLKNNPDNVYEFCANHMENLLIVRDAHSSKRTLTLEQKISKAQENIRERVTERHQRYDKELKLQYKKNLEKQELPLLNEIENFPEKSKSSVLNKRKALVHHELDLVDVSEVEISHEPCVVNSLEGGIEPYEVEIKPFYTSNNALFAVTMNDDTANTRDRYSIHHVEPKTENISMVIHDIELESKSDGELVSESTDVLETCESTELDKKYISECISIIGNNLIEDNRFESDSQVSQLGEVEMTLNIPPASTEKNAIVAVNEDNFAKLALTDIDKDTNLNKTGESTTLKIILTVNDIQNQEDSSSTEEPLPTNTNTKIDHVKIGEVTTEENVTTLVSYGSNTRDITVDEVILMNPVAVNSTQNGEHKKYEDIQILSSLSDIQKDKNTISETPQLVSKILFANEIKGENTQHCDMNDKNSQCEGEVKSGRQCEDLNLTDNRDLEKTDTENGFLQQFTLNDNSTSTVTVLFDGKETDFTPLEINKENSELPNKDNFSKQDKNETKDKAVEKCTSDDTTNLGGIDSVMEVNASKTSDEIDKIYVHDQNNMDLETAAITIQKVFRSFLFKNRNSTFEDTANDETNSLEEDNENKDEYYASANLTKDRRPLGITRMDTVLQTVNEEKSLSLSTDDSSTLSSAATVIQAHVRGYLVRNKLNSNKTSTFSLVNSNDPSVTSLEVDTDQHKNKTVLNIHIVPEGDNYLSRDDSVITLMDLSLDGSPPSSVNLHPLGYDKSERRKLKREDAVQSISPPSNNSGKVSEDVDSVKEVFNDNDIMSEMQVAESNLTQKTDSINTRRFETTSNENAAAVPANTDKCAEKGPISPTDAEKAIKRKIKTLSKMSSDEMDVVTPFNTSAEKKSLEESNDTSKLVHSGEFHDTVLPTKVSRADSSVVRGE